MSAPGAGSQAHLARVLAERKAPAPYEIADDRRIELVRTMGFQLPGYVEQRDAERAVVVPAEADAADPVRAEDRALPSESAFGT